MPERPNIVWMLVDSIRNYPTDADLRGKLPVMERFGREGIEFTTCVTTAPSTIMSITAMMTGLPAYVLARNYDDFRFDNRQHQSLAGILKENGYASYAFLRGLQTREKFRNLLDMVPRSYWMPHLRHGDKWTNQDLNLLLERVLQGGVSRPAFFFFHYNPQTPSAKRELLADPQVSNRVETALERLETAGFDRDNTVFVLCSDHGFPDPSTGLSSDWEAKHRLTHDLVLTDDNILIPLYIRFPGCRPTKIDTPVSSLDLFPTLLDLAGIGTSDALRDRIDGESLVRLMETGDEQAYPRRFFRSDSRLMLQTGRSTAIRSRDYKYVRYHDRHRFTLGAEVSSSSEVLIDLRRDPNERMNLLLDEPLSTHMRDVLEELRAEFEQSERVALEQQVRYLLQRQGAKLSGARTGGREHGVRCILLIFEPATAAFEEIGLGAMSSLHPDAQIDILSDRQSTSKGISSTGSRFVYGGEGGKRIAPALASNGAPSTYDLVAVFVQDPAAPITSELLTVARSVKSRRQIVLDCNFNAYGRRRYWYYRFRALLQSLPYMLEEPTLLISKARTGGKLVFRRIMRKIGLWERWGAALGTPRAGDE